MPAETTIRVVLYMQGKSWIAQALEYDLAAQDKTFSGTIRRLVETIADTYQRTCDKFGAPFAGIKPAPEEFHEMFDRAAGDEPVEFEIKPRLTRAPFPPVRPNIEARVLEASASA